MTSSADTAALPADIMRWRTVGPLATDEFAKARWETINLVQWLVRMANSFVPAARAEERVLLQFHPAETAFVTPTFCDSLSLELRLPSLEIQFREDGQVVPHIFDPEQRSPAEVEAWLLVEMLHRGVDREKFSKKLPYDIPGLMSGDADDHLPSLCAEGLKQLATWFANGAAVLTACAPSAPATIVCWPQTLALFLPGHGGAIGAAAGFCPGDSQIAEPYFYRSKPASNGSTSARATLTATTLAGERDPLAAAVAFMKSASG